MALIPQDPKQQKALVAGLGAIVVFYLFYSFWYTGQRTELDAEKEHVETLETKNRAAQITAARGGGQIEERLAAYERHVMVLEALIPASDEVPALLREITSEARRLIGADPASFRPEPDEPGEFYTKKAYQMQAIGEYHDIARFLTSVASLSRIITPVDLTLTPYTGSTQGGVTSAQNPIVADFRIETYVLPKAGETAAPPPAKVGG
jgi:type IV pilus assembly protein PilO